MELILADKSGNDIKNLVFSSADFDIGGENDFEITIALEEWQKEIDFNCRIYEPDSECGGIISAIETNTEDKTVKIKGYTWRGLLSKRIITPPSGSDYFTVSGELHTVMQQVIGNMYENVIQASTESTGKSVTRYRFDRYCTVLDGLVKMLKSIGYKLRIRYRQGELYNGSYAEISAVPIVDYSNEIELSQDSRINFMIEINRGIVNHLICLGKGELKEREVVDLYLQKDGSIGDTQYYEGVEELPDDTQKIAKALDFENGSPSYAEGVKIHFRDGDITTSEKSSIKLINGKWVKQN